MSTPGLQVPLSIHMEGQHWPWEYQEGRSPGEAPRGRALQACKGLLSVASGAQALGSLLTLPRKCPVWAFLDQQTDSCSPTRALAGVE